MPAAGKVRFLAQVSDVVERCQTGTNMEIHKSEVAMLYDVEPHGNGSGVVVAEFKIDGVHRGIERAGVRALRFLTTPLPHGSADLPHARQV